MGSPVNELLAKLSDIDCYAFVDIKSIFWSKYEIERYPGTHDSCSTENKIAFVGKRRLINSKSLLEKIIKPSCLSTDASGSLISGTRIFIQMKDLIT